MAVLETALASKWAPLAIQGGITGVSALYGALNPNRAEEIQQEVLNNMRTLTQEAHRKARGQFTPAERQTMRANAQPQLQQVAGTLASRGLGSSPAGAQIAAQAEQSVFSNAQALASQQEIILNRAAFDMTSTIIDQEAPIYEDLQMVSQGLHYLREMNMQNQTPEPEDPLITRMLKTLFGMFDPESATAGGTQ